MESDRSRDVFSETSEFFDQCLHALHEKDRLGYAGRFVQGFVHNVNGPLQNLSMLTEMLVGGMDRLARVCDSAPSEEEKAQCKEVVEKQRKRLEQMYQQISALADNLRDFMQLNELERNGKDIDLNFLIEKLVKAYRADLFFKHKVTPKLDLARNLPTVKINGCDLVPILFHVVQNAITAMRESSRKELTIATSHKDGRVRIEIRDSGCGLQDGCSTKDDFELFSSAWPEQDLAPMTEAARPLGYGLWAARRLLSVYDSVIRLEADSEGTVAVIEIPVGAK